MRDRTYRTIGRVSLGLDLSIPILILIAIVLGNLLTRDDVETRLAWSSVMVAVGANFAVRQALFSHRVTLRADDHVEFQKLTTIVVLHPRQILAIRPSRWFRSFLNIRTTYGLLLVPGEWTGLASLVGHVRRHNPACDLPGD